MGKWNRREFLKTTCCSAAAGFAAVVSGHSHKAKQEVKDGVLYFNPGSAGPRRFKLPISVGRIRIENGVLSAEVLLL